jgi:hypothetical protein
MNNRKVLKKEYLIISGVLILAGIVLGLFSSFSRATNASELFQYGMLKVVAGVFIMAGGIVLLIAGISSRNAQKSDLLHCPKCGMTIHTKNDRFCRSCGEALSN